ncbi:MAG: hypothetical protein AAF198_06400 [Pseudomonadota bacterium]
MRFTNEQRSKLKSYLSAITIPSGLGTKEAACSIAAINLAISGELSDKVPDCMSLALGRATIVLQDSMPSEMRNSPRYKELLPQMAGTGRDYEDERANVLLDWMWGVVLPSLQDFADQNGFGAEWRKMCKERSQAAASHAAADAADAAARAAYAAADAYAYAARAAAYAVAAAAARAAAYAGAAADAAEAAARAAAAAYAAAYAYADAADAAEAASFDKGFWEKIDPIGVLERATFLSQQ